MGRRYFDFDAFWEEQQAEPVTIKVFGTPHLLPPKLPAKIVLKSERVQQRGNESEMEPGEIRDLAEDMFGRQRVAEWLERDDFDLDKLVDLFKQTMTLYSRSADGDEEGEAPAPETGQSLTSLSTGESSKPTSNASTA